MSSFKKAVIIVAGGSGSRMQSAEPKQFLLLKNKPLLFYTIDIFLAFDSDIQVILVLPENQIEYWESLQKKYNYSPNITVVSGGQTRFHSVKNGLNAVNNDIEVIGVHDGVRPLVLTETINHCYEAAYKHQAAVPVLPLIESIRKLENKTSISISRDTYVSVQTPQCFTHSLLKKAYEQDYNNSFTDDASVVESTGCQIYLTQGNRENIKITYPFDLKIAELFL